MSTALSGSALYDENHLQVSNFCIRVHALPSFPVIRLLKALATPAKQALGPKRAFGDDITNSSKMEQKGSRTPMQHVSFTPRQSSAGDVPTDVVISCETAFHECSVQPCLPFPRVCPKFRHLLQKLRLLKLKTLNMRLEARSQRHVLTPLSLKLLLS